MVTWELVSKRQLQSIPAILTTAVHLDPISPLGSLAAGFLVYDCLIAHRLHLLPAVQFFSVPVPIHPVPGTVVILKALLQWKDDVCPNSNFLKTVSSSLQLMQDSTHCHIEV